MITCKFENGHTETLRHVTVEALVLKERKILLVRRAQQLLEGGKWALPGGFVERDETVKEAIVREIKEETGYQVADIQLLTIRDNPDRPHEDRQNISFVFVCQATQKVGESDWEVEQLEWFSLDKLPPKAKIAFDHYQNIELYTSHATPIDFPLQKI